MRRWRRRCSPGWSIDADPDAWRTALVRCEAVGNPYDIARARHWLAEAILDAGGSSAEAAASSPPRWPRQAGWPRGSSGDTRPRPPGTPGARHRRERTGGDPTAGLDGRETPDRPPAAPLDDLVEPLTPREREVLGYSPSGWTNRRIGEALFISDKTVSVHVSNLLGKLGDQTGRRPR